MQPIMLEVTVVAKEGGGQTVTVLGYDIVRGVGLVYKDGIDGGAREDVADDLADFLSETWVGNEGV